MKLLVERESMKRMKSKLNWLASGSLENRAAEANQSSHSSDEKNLIRRYSLSNRIRSTLMIWIISTSMGIDFLLVRDPNLLLARGDKWPKLLPEEIEKSSELALKNSLNVHSSSSYATSSACSVKLESFEEINHEGKRVSRNHHQNLFASTKSAVIVVAHPWNFSDFLSVTRLLLMTLERCSVSVNIDFTPALERGMMMMLFRISLWVIIWINAHW
jgi:hypothetical protein